MDPQSPNKLIATKYCFLILGDDTSFFFFISLFFVVFVVVVVVILCHYLFLQKLFYYYYFILFIHFFIESCFIFFMFRDVPVCSGMFRDVPECSGMFHVPDFIDAHLTLGQIIVSNLTNVHEPNSRVNYARLH